MGLSYFYPNTYWTDLVCLDVRNGGDPPIRDFLPSLRVQLDQEMSEREHRESLLAQLELLDKKRLKAAEHTQVYQKRLSKFYQKKVIERKFKIEEMVVKQKMVKPGHPASKF